jgi:hypothetical protein
MDFQQKNPRRVENSMRISELLPFDLGYIIKLRAQNSTHIRWRADASSSCGSRSRRLDSLGGWRHSFLEIANRGGVR